MAPSLKPDKPRAHGCLSIALPIAVLMALGLYSAVPHPTRDKATLRAVSLEAQQLLTTTARSSTQPVSVPQRAWPPMIASLKPTSVTIRQGVVDMPTKPSFDGGWGYGYAKDKRHLPMLQECWSELGYDVYWHGPC